MQTTNEAGHYDVAIIGGGPAGLNAAVVLGRACRRVVLFDHGKPRNYAARALHGFLGFDGVIPAKLLEHGRREAQTYDVKTDRSEVVAVECLAAQTDNGKLPRFKITADKRSFITRAVLFATGVVDEVPEIRGLHEMYGLCVHHCPYCDAWEHRGKRLVALARGPAAAKLAISLMPWSNNICCCANGQKLSPADCQLLSDNGIEVREEAVIEITRSDKSEVELRFIHGEPYHCGAIFFGASQHQHSKLPRRLGCEIDDEGLIRRDSKQHTCVEGVFVAGDAAGDVQFAIVAAAQGATAAAGIHRYLLDQEVRNPAAVGRHSI